MNANALLILMVVGATACGGSQPAPATPSSQSNNSNANDNGATGATNAQASDRSNHPMSKTECQQLGEYIAGMCHDEHTREARIEGWCSDIVERTNSGNWVSDCTKSMTYMDSVCFRSTDNVPAMMVCDRSAQ